MKKFLIVIVNIAIMATILTFVVLYAGYESRDSYRRQIENFENTTVTMEHVTENYLEGEQRICDVWAQYINNSNMTMEEAAEYIRSSHVLENTSAHIISTDTLTGLSTRPGIGTTDEYEVSYQRLDLLKNTDWIDEIGKSINITRAYTNPMNGEQSLAFCNMVTLRNPDSDAAETAVLLRVIPISDLEQKWVFPQTELVNAELSMIDAGGDYILKGHNYKNSSFFEFYESYNQTDPESSKELFDKITSSTGSVSMINSHGQECILAYTPISATSGWTMLGLVPADDLKVDTENHVLFIVVSVGLLILFLSDLFYMRYLNKRLQIAARKAESANKAKTDFLSTMSHDIRTPMNAIIGLTTLAEKNPGDVESTKESLRKISLASNHLLTLINDILDISKVESGKLKLSPLTFSIVETVENLVNISQPMIKEKNIEFSFHINQFEKEYLYTDQLRLNQIFINILSNAIKYTEPGGRVSVELREEHSDVTGCIKLIYVVSDTGIGMSPEFMENMYKPFSRQVDSRVNSIQGTGLGLAITKQMVDLIGGAIDCQSEQGKGTTFTVTLDIPVADRQREDMKLEPIDVLIVDDDETMLQTATDTLTSLGANVEQANNGLEALGMIEHRHLSGRDYTVIIIDWKMPDIDGLETIKRIRSEIDSQIPILLISAYDWSDIEDKARSAGANGFVSKPLFRSTLYDKINGLFGKESGSVEPEDDYSDLNEMNGLDATRTIRKLENPWAASIPIVAMTADAFSENIMECLDAGMNGHIAKPVDIKLVIKEIRRIREGKV